MRWIKMNKKEVIMPTKEEVIKLLEVAKNDDIIPIHSIGELIGMKWVDGLLPKIEGAPAWGYDGLVKFFKDYGIDNNDSFEEALKKIVAN